MALLLAVVPTTDMEWASRRMKLCKDCRWAKNLLGPEWFKTRLHYDWVCEHPTSVNPMRPDYVMGNHRPAEQMRCIVARAAPLNECCGPKGRYWEAREAC